MGVKSTRKLLLETVLYVLLIPFTSEMIDCHEKCSPTIEIGQTLKSYTRPRPSLGLTSTSHFTFVALLFEYKSCSAAYC